MDITALRNELTNDPLARGYPGMTDAQAAASLNTRNRSRLKSTMQATQLYEAMDSAEFQSKTDAQKQYVRDILSLSGDIPINGGSKARAVLLAIFGGGSATATNLTAALTETISRAEELGLGVVGDGHVASARLL